MRIKEWIPVIICFAIMAIGISLIVDFREFRVPDLYLYKGKVLMEEAEYTEFKTILAREDVIIQGLNAYSSDTPLVIFQVQVPATIEFPWGEHIRTSYVYPEVPIAKGLVAWVFAIVGGFAGLVFLAFRSPAWARGK